MAFVDLAFAAAMKGDFAESTKLFGAALNNASSDRLRPALREGAARLWPSAAESAIAVWENVAVDDASVMSFNLACALWACDELDLGLQAFQFAADLGDSDALLALGEGQLYVKNFVAAEGTLRAVLAETPSNQRASGLLGGLLFRQGNRLDEEVVSLLMRASNLEPEFPIDLAEVYIARRDYDDARGILDHEAARGNQLAPIVLGNLLWHQYGAVGLAEEAYRRGVQLGDAYSAYNLAALLDSNDRPAESRTWLEYAAEHGDSSALKRLKDPNT